MAHIDLKPNELPEKYWQPENWSPRHRLICQLSTLGMKGREIAGALGLSESHVSVVLNDPRARAEIEEAITNVADNIVDLHDRLKAHAVEAVDEIVDEMRNSKDERIRQKASFGILDRAGYTPVQKSIRLGAQIPASVADRVERALRDISDIPEGEYEYVEHDLPSEESSADSDA